MAYIGQKVALGKVGAFCSFLGFNQLRGAFLHQFLQMMAILAQFLIESFLRGDVLTETGESGNFL